MDQALSTNHFKKNFWKKKLKANANVQNNNIPLWQRMNISQDMIKSAHVYITQ